MCCLRVSASCAVLLSLCCVSRRTVSRASSLVWPALLCARPVRRVCSRVTRCALCCVYICSWSVYLPGLSLVVAGLHPFLVCVSFWSVSASLRLHFISSWPVYLPGLYLVVAGLHLFLICISFWSVHLVVASTSLPGLYMFLVCISSLRPHLFPVCISSWSSTRCCVYLSSWSVWSSCVLRLSACARSKSLSSLNGDHEGPVGELVVLER